MWTGLSADVRKLKHSDSTLALDDRLNCGARQASDEIYFRMMQQAIMESSQVHFLY